jgi:hypothetical protein
MARPYLPSFFGRGDDPFGSLFREVQKTFEDFSQRTPFARFSSDTLSRTAASPPRDAALLSRRATILDRTAAARVGRIAAQLLPMFLGSEGVLEFLARRAAIDILLRQIDEVLLAKATFRLCARGHWLGQRHGDPRAIASQDLIAVEVATIGDGIELIGLQNGLRFVGDVRKLRAIRAHIRHLVRDDEMALGIDRDLHIVAHDAGAAP